ncbi:hypothetical protein FB45DRAFT_55252 [Roridomyces roridus]|uniref:Uncharacterized protein n=1 Tax=Roridomyces roridus TaxID=1738132 RepID=A0AAD7FIT6_9AGAR|nr:hypothetical protein FB45DRAFT_55252 [Roridomyces roridus]
MPTKAAPSPEEEVIQLRKQLAEAKKKIAEIAKQQSKPKKLIPRPKGQAGKGKGYRLQTAMRLGKNKTRYNHLSKIVRHYASRFLMTGKTIQKQNPTTLATVIARIKRDFTYFQRFDGGWPIRDLIKQFLTNHNYKFKRAAKEEKEAEKHDPAEWDDDVEAEAEENDGESVGGSDSEMEDVVVDGEDGEAGEDGLELDTGDCDEMDGVEEMEDAPLDLDLEEIKENVESSKTPNAVKTNKTKAETPVKKSKLKSKSSPRPPSPSPLRTRKLNDPEPLSLRPAKKLKPLVCPGKKRNTWMPKTHHWMPRSVKCSRSTTPSWLKLRTTAGPSQSILINYPAASSPSCRT